MKKQDSYSLTELIRNDEFIAWVLHPNEGRDLKWATFLEKYPNKLPTVEAAREYVILLARDTGRQVPSERQSDKMWRVVEKEIRNSK